MEPPDPTFMLWASTYVVLKWTAGVWLIRTVRRRVKASQSDHPGIETLRSFFQLEGLVVLGSGISSVV